MKTPGRFGWLVGAGLLAASVDALAMPAPVFRIVGVSVTDIGTLGGDWAVAWDINNSGHIVGASKTSLGQDHAFFYKPSGVMFDISPPFALGGSEARAINQVNEVAANYSDPSSWPGDHGYRWSGGTAYPLNDTDPAGVPGGSRVWGISDRGLIAGQRVATTPASTTAAVWTSDTTYVLLSAPGVASYAKDVNAGGLIVGHQGSDQTPRRWRLLWGSIVVSDIVPTPLPVSMFSMGTNEGVNRKGAVAGLISCCIGTPSVRRHAWTWDGSSPAGVHIGVLWPGGFSQGEDINNNGIVAGYAQRPSPPHYSSDEWDAAILYHRDFGIYQLPALSKVYHSCRASALNDLSGGVLQVVGVCLQQLGMYRAVRWDVKVEQVFGP